MAAGRELRAGRERRVVLVRARQGGQVLGAQLAEGDGAPHPQGRRGLIGASRGDPARLLQHRLLLRGVLGEPPDRPPAARSRSSAASARRRSTSASAAATARTSAPSRTGWSDIAGLPDVGGGAATDLHEARGESVRRPRRAAREGVRRGRRGTRPGACSPPTARAATRPRRSPSRTRTSAKERPRDPASALDWLGNDKSTPVSEVGTFPCRALHSNHMEGHVWQEYGSETYRARPADADLSDLSGGGRGYYRNISLLNAWAHAPFMHNNAIGPELCGQPANAANDFYRSPYVDESGTALAADKAPPACPTTRASKAATTLYKASMEEPAEPQDTGSARSACSTSPSASTSDRAAFGRDGARRSCRCPPSSSRQGSPPRFFGNFQHKAFFGDLVGRRPAGRAQGPARRSAIGAARASDGQGAGADGRRDPRATRTGSPEIARPRLPHLKELYLSCTAEVENDGHRFGESLPRRTRRRSSPSWPRCEPRRDAPGGLALALALAACACGPTSRSRLRRRLRDEGGLRAARAPLPADPRATS